jgi:hypothetical protein
LDSGPKPLKSLDRRKGDPWIFLPFPLKVVPRRFGFCFRGLGKRFLSAGRQAALVLGLTSSV